MVCSSHIQLLNLKAGRQVLTLPMLQIFTEIPKYCSVLSGKNLKLLGIFFFIHISLVKTEQPHLSYRITPTDQNKNVNEWQTVENTAYDKKQSGC
jgi:hypothetical protein